MRGWCIGTAFGSRYGRGVLLEQAEIAADVGTVLAFKVRVRVAVRATAWIRYTLVYEY